MYDLACIITAANQKAKHIFSNRFLLLCNEATPHQFRSAVFLDSDVV